MLAKYWSRGRRRIKRAVGPDAETEELPDERIKTEEQV